MRTGTIFAVLLILAGCGARESTEEVAGTGAEAAPSEAEAVPEEPTAEPEAAGDDNWLEGTWVLTYDPKNNPTDWLVFSAPDAVTLRTPDGREIAGTFSVREDKVLLKFPMNQRTFSIPLQPSDDRTTLTNESGAYYTRS